MGPPDDTSLPDGYPAELERHLTDNTGRRFLVRPVVPGDAEQLAEEIKQADAETLYLRFFTPNFKADGQRIRYLTNVDYVYRLAVAVIDESDGNGVAIARYEGRPGSKAAEIAVTVKPAWRSVGLGSELVILLEEAAVARGIERFEAIYLAGNRGAAGLMKATGFHVEDVDAGVVTVAKDLGGG
ncbi:MAG: GNAT family N-acetyltransferase [Acidimicrobiia bacterium]